MNEFLKDKGKAIQEVFPDFSIDIKDWHFDYHLETIWLL